MLLKIVLISVLLVTVHGASWQRSKLLNDEHNVELRWNLTVDGQWIEMQVSAPTTGYIGIGLSPNGAMRGSDIVVGWVDSNGNGHLKDMHGIGNQLPKLDTQQDYQLIHATESDGVTTIQFKRRLQTCDEEHDAAITNDTTRIIWALGNSDPRLFGDEVIFDYHGTEKRGVKSVYLTSNPLLKPFPDQLEVMDPDVKYYDFRIDNKLVNEDTTTYFCKIVRFPKLDRKHHMIGYRPLIDKRKNVHHMVLYECVVPEWAGNTHAMFEAHLEHEGAKCYTPNMPPDWSQYCVTFFTTWVSGSEGEMLPDHVGAPMGEQFDGATYYMFEIHYDNPQRSTFRDSSGLRIFYTDKLRDYDANVFLASYRITPFLLIPPQQQEFTTYGICSSECTRKSLPPEGIKLIYVLFHAHLAGRNGKLRHFRNGVELAPVSEDKAYDFNYQQPRFLSEEVTVLPGDELLLECGFETMDRNRSVVGGLSSREEMCQAFIMYYPKAAVSLCSSQVELSDFFSALGLKSVTSDVFEPMNLPYDPTKWPEDRQKLDQTDNAKDLETIAQGVTFNDIFDLMHIQDAGPSYNMTVGDYMQTLNWTDARFGKSVQESWRNNRHYAYCTSHGRKRIPLDDFIIKVPQVDKPYVTTSPMCASTSAAAPALVVPVISIICIVSACIGTLLQ